MKQNFLSAENLINGVVVTGLLQIIYVLELWQQHNRDRHHDDSNLYLAWQKRGDMINFDR